MSYLVVHHHWINGRNILWEVHLTFHFRMLSYNYLVLFWCCHIVWLTCVFHTFASFYVSLELVWQPGSLINMDGTNQLTSRTMAGSGSLNSSRLKLLNSAIKWWRLLTTYICSQNNYKIENGSKKTFTIIPKSVKFVNVFFHEWYPIYSISAHFKVWADGMVFMALRAHQVG